MPWSRSATTVRNAPALGFKQQYAGSPMDGEQMDGEVDPVNPVSEFEEGDARVETALTAVHNAEQNLPEQDAAVLGSTMDAVEAMEETLMSNLEEVKEDKDLLIAELQRRVEECEDKLNGVHETPMQEAETEKRLQLMKQIRLKNLHKRLAHLRASKMLDARVQPYARPARHFSARAAPSPISTSRLARRMQRTRF